MTDEEKQVILDAAKDFVRERIAPNHITNTRKLRSLSEFNVNPFLEKYLAQFAFGEVAEEFDSSDLLEQTVQYLAEEIKEQD